MLMSFPKQQLPIEPVARNQEEMDAERLVKIRFHRPF